MLDEGAHGVERGVLAHGLEAVGAGGCAGVEVVGPALAQGAALVAHPGAVQALEAQGSAGSCRRRREVLVVVEEVALHHVDRIAEEVRVGLDRGRRGQATPTDSFGDVPATGAAWRSRLRGHC